MEPTVRRALADRVWQRRRVVYASSLGFVGLVVLIVFFSISTPAAMELSSEPSFFNAERSLRTAQELSTLYPERTPGSADAAGALAWYTERLAELDIAHETRSFKVSLGGEDTELTSVTVVLPGASNDALLVSASRDVEDAPATALDQATGTAVLLDLIQVFAARPHEKTLIFVSTEGATYAGLGLALTLDAEPRTAEVRAGLSLGPLGRSGLEELHGGVIGPGSATPGWLVRLTEASLRRADYRLATPGLTDQVAAQALGLAEGEQVASLRAGIPALLLRGATAEEQGVTSSSLGTQGVAVERLLLSLDAGSDLPADPGTALVLSSGRYVSLSALTALAVAMVLPSLAVALTWVAGTRLRPEGWMRFLRNLVSFSLPLAGVIGAALLAALAGLIPHYPYQAPVNDPPATDARLIPTLLLVVVGVGLFFLSRRFLGYLRPREPVVMAEMGKLTIGLLALAGGLVLLTSHSPFSVLTGISAAWLWPLVTCFSDPRPALFSWVPAFRTNALLLLGGLLAPLLLYGYLAFAVDLGLGSSLWFLVVQTVSGAYGVKGPAAFVLITSGFLVLLGVRRLRLQPVETWEAGGHPEAVPLSQWASTSRGGRVG